MRASTKRKPGAPAVVLEVGFLERARVVVGEAVDADHLRAASSSAPVRCEPMNPAAPVTSAFMRRPGGSRSGSRQGLPAAIERGVDGAPDAATDWSSPAHDFVRELHSHRRQHPSFRPYFELVVVLAGWRYSQCASITGSETPSASISR